MCIMFIIVLLLERFNQNGAFTVKGGHDDLSFAGIRRKVTKQFFDKIGLK